MGAISSNQVGRTDFTPIVLAELAFLMLSLRRLWYIGESSCRGKKGDELHIPCYLQVLGLEIRVMHLTCPSMIRVYDCDRS